MSAWGGTSSVTIFQSYDDGRRSERAENVAFSDVYFAGRLTATSVDSLLVNSILELRALSRRLYCSARSCSDKFSNLSLLISSVWSSGLEFKVDTVLFSSEISPEYLLVF